MVNKVNDDLGAGAEQRSLIERAASRLKSHNVELDSNRPPQTGAGCRPHPERQDQFGRGVARSATSKRLAIDFDRLHDNGIITPKNLSKKVTEEFRLLKRPILTTYAQNKSDMANLILVTSAVAKEGKTFTALNLAMSIALERDFRVLLVDGDLFKPRISQLLGITGERGLVDVLTDDGLDLADVMMRTDIDGLTVLPPGRPHELSTELLASKKMAQLMGELSQRYADRFIIFDSPPVLVTTETATLAAHVGQVVFVIRAQSTSRDAVQDALNLIGDSANIGLVLNRARASFGSANFGTYYDQYHQAYRAAPDKSAA